VTSSTQSRIRLVLWTVLFVALLIALLMEFHWTRQRGLGNLGGRTPGSRPLTPARILSSGRR